MNQMLCALVLISLIPHVLTQCFKPPDEAPMCYRMPDPDVADVICPLQTASLDSANPIPRTSPTDPFIDTIVNDSALESRCDCLSSNRFTFNIMLRLETNLNWYITWIISQELMSSEPNVNTVDKALQVAPNVDNDPYGAPKHCKEMIASHGIDGVILDALSFVSTNSFSLPRMRRDKLDLIACIQEEPTHPRGTNSSFTPIRCDNAPEHNNAHVVQHQSVCVDIEHSQRDEAHSNLFRIQSFGIQFVSNPIVSNRSEPNILINVPLHFVQRSHACSTHKCVGILFILLIIWLTLFGYTCLYRKASWDVIEPPHVDDNQSDS
eukprot:847712_1